MPRMVRRAAAGVRKVVEVECAQTGRDGVGVLTAAERQAATVEEWFALKGWSPYPFQREAWAAYAKGESGLIHVPTGAGKTYAAFGGPLGELIQRPADGLAVLYVTPLRAVSRDIEKALALPVRDLGLTARVESRTGDTSAGLRARQRRELPQVLITTPESLSLLLTQEDAAAKFAALRCVIVDEWHELLTSKRGVQVELALARLRRFATGLRTWALSATVRDVEAAARAVVGVTTLDGSSESSASSTGKTPVPTGIDREATLTPPCTVVTAALNRQVIVESLIPAEVDAFPWAGHLGLSMLEPLLDWLDPAHSTLIFVNTRSQAELWFQAILNAKPEWAEWLALHHGSIDRDVREKVEAGMKEGWLRFTVCTSSLDLGVDFSPVERVVQIGSPKGIARLIQRAGRASHRPGAACRILCVPTHAMELVEIAATRDAISQREIEERPGLSKPLDVLVQHLVTCAMGGGFDARDLFREVRTTSAFADLSWEEFEWCLALVEHGGETLKAYKDFQRIQLMNGQFIGVGGRIAQMHRLNVGTITSDSVVKIRYRGGKTLGTIEEFFVSRLREGDVFVFGGKTLEFVGLYELTAFVRPARKRTGVTPHWNGARFPLSTALARSVRRNLDRLSAGPVSDKQVPELTAAEPAIEAQRRISAVPRLNEILFEICRTSIGSHLFMFPFDGRLVHEGVAALVAWRLASRRKATFELSMNDYGIEIVSEQDFPFAEHLDRELFTTDGLVTDMVNGVNVGELSRRQFREIARVAGLVMQRYPGAERSGRQLQAGASLLYDVFEQFDPENLLLHQARREVLERQFEQSRLARTLQRMSTAAWIVKSTSRLSPLAFPLVASRLGSTQVSTETIIEQLRNQSRMVTV